jgi:transposase InsO family protein
MNTHKNARLTLHGRALMVQRIIEEGWPVAKAAAAAGVAKRTGYKWLARYRAGERMLADRSSAPRCCPHRLPDATVAGIERLRRLRMSGPAIARQLGLSRSTVGAVLRRLGLGRLKALEEKPPVVRYQRAAPGELIHIDTKRLVHLAGIGHRITGLSAGRRKTNRGLGYDFVHVCVDDASRLAYTEILPDEKKDSACAFLTRATAFFARHGVTVKEVMTDNAMIYRCRDYARRCADLGLRHIRTRPYTPRTNGKAERFIQTALREWAYARPYHSSAERADAMSPWIDGYNTQRPHSAIAYQTPWQRMNNLLGNDI